MGGYERIRVVPLAYFYGILVQVSPPTPLANTILYLCAFLGIFHRLHWNIFTQMISFWSAIGGIQPSFG